MKFVDGITLEDSSVFEVLQALEDIKRGATDASAYSIQVTDNRGNLVHRVKLFENRLSDGSKTYSIEIHFSEE